MDSSYDADQSRIGYLEIGGALVIISSILTLAFVLSFSSYYDNDGSLSHLGASQSLLDIMLLVHCISGISGIFGGMLALLKKRYRLSMALCLTSSLGLAFVLSLAGSALVAISKNDFSEMKLKKNIEWIENNLASGDQLDHSSMVRRGG